MAELGSGDTSPLKGPAPKALPEDTSDVDKPDDAMPLTSPGDQGVQFIRGQPANGDAKVDIPDAGAPAFVGLGKEELMKYANDPFWVKLRWFLFILFWVLWFAMLTGAIVIIVLAPKCAEKRSHPQTYYQLDVKQFTQEGKLSELGKRAEYLGQLGVNSVIISDVLKKENGATVDFKDVEPEFGTLDDFVEALKALKAKGIRILLSLVPNHSSLSHEWFKDVTKYEDYYIRKLAVDVASSNWEKVDRAGPAWVDDPSAPTKKFLQLFESNADLNFRNDKVIDEMKDVLSFWKSKGVDGFSFSDVSYLVEDLGRLEDVNATKNQPENREVLKKILNRNPEDPLTLIEVSGLNKTQRDAYIEYGLAPYTSENSLRGPLTVASLQEFFKPIHSGNLAFIPGQLDGTATDEDDYIYQLLAFSSNASVLLKAGEEQEQNENSNWTTRYSTNSSSFKFVHKLAKVLGEIVDDKEHKDLVYDYILTQPTNPTVFGFVRSGKFITLINVGNSEITYDFAKPLNLEDPNSKAKVLVATPNAEALKEGEIMDKQVQLPPHSGVILKREDAS